MSELEARDPEGHDVILPCLVAGSGPCAGGAAVDAAAVRRRRLRLRVQRNHRFKRMHSDEPSKSGNKSGYDHWSKKSNQEIIDSLKPGKKDSLKVKEDGTVVDGNARILILQQRGVDVNSLPREIHKPQPMEGAP